MKVKVGASPLYSLVDVGPFFVASPALDSPSTPLDCVLSLSFWLYCIVSVHAKKLVKKLKNEKHTPGSCERKGYKNWWLNKQDGSDRLSQINQPT